VVGRDLHHPDRQPVVRARARGDRRSAADSRHGAHIDPGHRHSRCRGVRRRAYVREALMTDPIQTIFGIKLSTLAAAGIMAVLAVLLDIKRHSWLTGSLAVIAGMAVAVLATEQIVAGLNLPGDWSNAVAGVLGISG